MSFKKVASVLSNEYWLLISLSGAFFSFFALNRGGVVVFIEFSGAFLLINILSGNYRLKMIPAGYWVTTAIAAWLVLVSFLISPHETHYNWSMGVVRLLCVVFAVHCLSQKTRGTNVKWLVCGLVSLAVCWQFTAHHIFNMPYGTFSNLHYLATFTVLILPLIFFYFVIAKGWYKLILVLVAIMALDLLMGTGSRPAFLGLTIGSIFVLVFFTAGKWKWIGLCAVCGFIAVVVISGYGNMGTRMAALVADIPHEERIQLWTQSWNTLRENSVAEWIWGQGIKWFPTTYQQEADSPVVSFVFPHLHFLEILYLNGIIGTILIFGGFLSLLIAMLVNNRKPACNEVRLFGNCMTVVFIIWLINCSLVYPFYSKYSIYPLAFILSVMLLLIQKHE